jgi:hypothetical protein
MLLEKAEKIFCFSTVLEVLMNGSGNKKENVPEAVIS